MRIGCVREIKTHEYRVGLTPSCVKDYIRHGHQVLMEAGAGRGAGYTDQEYIEAGASIAEARENVFHNSDMIIKVKEPQADEIAMLEKGQILFTYLHLAADLEQTQGLINSGAKAIAYETIEGPDGSLPCLRPMSEIAGRLSVQEGAKYLEKHFGGRGVLLGGVPGVPRGDIVILGGGVVGTNAAQIAMGLGANVTILDINAKRLAYLDQLYFGRINTLYSTEATIEEMIQKADVLIGAVLIPGAKAPRLVTKDQLKLMKKGAVIVDVDVDQGGCIETAKPTTHDEPTYKVENIIHYCVTNMPGGVARTATQALTSSTLHYGLEIADKGFEKALLDNPGLMKGLNIYKGQVTYPDVAEVFDLPYVDPYTVIK
ncbi:alanine dehydrogenase [Spirochaeta cellobiosiphila]|uniref:alanine dehydrogenase n=1 Tax=Spirochaeta cellobiosiphila TaxID=504483 RepID=UPI000423D4D5|nr:alanine dehydrogenase [Spirochaeta cellobiosiphila]